jgi:hypothetical protein
MRVIDPGDPPEPRDQVAGEDRIEVDGADPIHFPKKQEKKEPDLIFGIKQLPALRPHGQPVLPVRPVGQRERAPGSPPNQGHRKTRVGQGSTDPNHPLIEVQIIGHRTKDPLFHRANMDNLPHITQLRVDNRHFYCIFAPDNNNFGKIVLILPPAIELQRFLDDKTYF